MRVTDTITRGFRALSVHYPKILPADELEGYEAAYNLHPGYLPWGRGHFPLVWAIWLGEPAGATVHRMTARVDSGPIVDQVRVPVLALDTAYSLFGRIRHAERRLFTTWWQRIASGRPIPETPQRSGGSYHSKRDFELLLDTDPAGLAPHAVDRLTRALTFPGKPGLGSSRRRRANGHASDAPFGGGRKETS